MFFNSFKKHVASLVKKVDSKYDVSDVNEVKGKMELLEMRIDKVEKMFGLVFDSIQ